MQAAPRLAWEEENGGSGSAAFAALTQTAEAEGGELRSHLPPSAGSRTRLPAEKEEGGSGAQFSSCLTETERHELPSPVHSHAGRPAACMGRGKRRERICSFRGSYANRGSGRERASFDVPKGGARLRPAPQSCRPLDNFPFWMYLYIRIQDIHPAALCLSRPENRPRLVCAARCKLSR